MFVSIANPRNQNNLWQQQRLSLRSGSEAVLALRFVLVFSLRAFLDFFRLWLL